MSRAAGRAQAGLVVLVLAVLAGLAGPAPVGTAQAGTAQAGTAQASTQGGGATGRDRVAVLLTSLEPLAPTAADTLTVRVRLRNDSDDPVRSLRLQLGVGSRLSTRSALTAADSGVGTASARLASTQELPDVLPAGASLLATVSVPVADLRLGRLGVYPLNLAVTGRAGGARSTVGELRTFLPWFPDGVEAPVRLAFLVPLVADPVPGAPYGGDPTSPLAPGGRLGALVAAGRAAQDQQPPPVVTPPALPPGAPDASPVPLPSPPVPPTPPVPSAPPAQLRAPVPLTWVIDPALLETARTLTGPYRVRGETVTDPDAGPAAEDGTVAGLDQAVAADFLAALAAATADRPVVPLPYADVDVVALERAGLGQEVLLARALGRELLAEVLPRARAQAQVAWPADGAVTTAAARLLARDGVTAVVLSDAALPPDERVTFSAGARTTLSAPDLVAAVSDSVLDTLVARQSGRSPAAPGLSSRAADDAVRDEQASPRLAVQRFLAETALIAAERGVTRDFVVAPPRDWDPDPAYVTTLLGMPGTVPWLTGTTLPDVLAGPVADAERGDLRYPAEARRAELPTAVLTGTAAVRARLVSIGSALTDDSLLTAASRRLTTASSTAWRDDPAMPGRIRAGVRTDLDDVAGAVRITTVGRVTLTSRTGLIPVTVSNDLDQPVRVRLDVQAQQAARLADSPPQETVLVAPGARQTLSVSATVRTSGTFPVEVRLLSPGGEPLGPATELLLTSSAYGRTALGITLAAGAVLLVAMGVRLTRRALRSRAGRTEHGTGPT